MTWLTLNISIVSNIFKRFMTKGKLWLRDWIGPFFSPSKLRSAYVCWLDWEELLWLTHDLQVARGVSRK